MQDQIKLHYFSLISPHSRLLEVKMQRSGFLQQSKTISAIFLTVLYRKILLNYRGQLDVILLCDFVTAVWCS